MTNLTRTQENVLYNKLRLIKGQTRQQLCCQEGTLRALTSSGFALVKEPLFPIYKGNLFYLNQSLEFEPKIFNRENLLEIWLETDPSERSPYKLYGNPPMWKTIEFPDGLILYSRPSKVITSTHEKVDGISYQFQLDGQWIGQGSQCGFTYFEENISPNLQNNLDYLRRIANQ